MNKLSKTVKIFSKQAENSYICRMYIANPIYDVVFKYLMKDAKVAKLLLGAIIDKEIVDIAFRSTETASKIRTSLTVFRMDFSARIIDKSGQEELVIIELQKAKLPSDIMRFRRYLGNQYASPNNAVKEIIEGEEFVVKPLPIISIYFLGHRLDYAQAPVIKVNRKYFDVATQKEIAQKESFIENLTHDSFIIQIPYLQGKRRTELEKLLSIFDQTQKKEDNRHILDIEEKAIPPKYQPLLRRLLKAYSDPKVHETMSTEDEIIQDLKKMERRIEAKDKVIETKDKAIEAKDKVIETKDKVIETKDKAIEAKDKVIETKDKVLKEQQRQIEELKRKLNL